MSLSGSHRAAIITIHEANPRALPRDICRKVKRDYGFDVTPEQVEAVIDEQQRATSGSAVLVIFTGEEGDRDPRDKGNRRPRPPR